MSNINRLARDFLKLNTGVEPSKNTPVQELSEHEYLSSIKLIESNKGCAAHELEKRWIIARFYLMDPENLPKWFKKHILRKKLSDIHDFLQMPVLRIIKGIVEKNNE